MPSDKINLSNPAALGAALKGDIENARIASTPGGIEAQEAAGQQSLVSNFDRIPRRWGWGDESFPAEVLERLGFKIGEPIDDIFIAVTPPAGWRMEATGHSMHSDILDEHGRKRASVFYKAAFYDRRADGHLLTRYRVDSENRGPEEWRSQKWETAQNRYVVVDTATGARVNEQPWITTRSWADSDQQRAACEAFLNQLFPDWRNPEAYW
jgi:hypothetical protein